jgi:pSer/pThr/pTyr-binding forkhead associated (FHA) protein
MQAVLVMFRSDGERRSFSITRSITVIGRREDCDLRIPLGDVSRKHCRIVLEEDTLRLEDLGSSNGTYHNGQRVEKDAFLQAGDSIQVGPVVFVLQVDGVPADEELQPIAVESAVAGGGPAPIPVGGTELVEELEPIPVGEEELNPDDLAAELAAGGSGELEPAAGQPADGEHATPAGNGAGEEYLEELEALPLTEDDLGFDPDNPLKLDDHAATDAGDLHLDHADADAEQQPHRQQ